MVLKTKLSLGLGFLFLIIFALAFFCAYYVGRLGQESDNILKDNYNSIVYAKNMLSGLDDMKTSVSSAAYDPKRAGTMSDYYPRFFESGKGLFEDNLNAEKKNITEIHESEYVEALNRDYEMFAKLCLQMKGGTGDRSVYLDDFLPAADRLKNSITQIYDTNMQAVVRKSQSVKSDSSRFSDSMAIIGTLCLILALGYFWYFPVYFSTSQSYLAGRMRTLLRNSGISFDDTINDETNFLRHAMDLLENRLGLKVGAAQNPKNDQR